MYFYNDKQKDQYGNSDPCMIKIEPDFIGRSTLSGVSFNGGNGSNEASTDITIAKRSINTATRIPIHGTYDSKTQTSETPGLTYKLTAYVKIKDGVDQLDIDDGKVIYSLGETMTNVLCDEIYKNGADVVIKISELEEKILNTVSDKLKTIKSYGDGFRISLDKDSYRC